MPHTETKKLKANIIMRKIIRILALVGALVCSYFLFKGIHIEKSKEVVKEETIKLTSKVEEQVKVLNNKKQEYTNPDSDDSLEIIDIYNKHYYVTNIDGVIDIGKGYITEPVIIDHKQKYLRALPNGKYAIEGTVIVYGGDKQSLNDNYCVYYGHGMYNGTRFGKLLGVNVDKDKIKNGELYTREGKIDIELVYMTTVDFKTFNNLDLTNYKEIEKLIGENADISTKDFLLTLTTCELDDGAHRVIVIYKKTIK